MKTSVSTAMLIHDSAIGIKELKFDFAVVDANTPPMNAHDPWPSDRAEAMKNQSHL